MHVRIVAIIGLALVAASGVEAQEPPPADPQVFRLAIGSLPLPAAFVSAAVQQPTAQQPAAPPRPATRPTTTRRRGSMVGYIDDATIESRVRVRFDSALENTVPDRAEFFYAKCGGYADLPPGNPAHDGDAPGPRPGAATELNFQQLEFRGEYAFNTIMSAFVQLPVRWLEPQAFDPSTIPPGDTAFGNQSGLSDMRAGFKAGFAPAEHHTVTAQAQFFFPTGEASKGLGTDHASIEPAVLYNWQATDIVTVESQFAVWLPFGGSAGVPTSVDDDFSGRVLTWGVGSGVNVYRRTDFEVGPVVELVGWRVLSGFQTAAPADASDTNIVNLKIGGRATLDATHSVYVGWGKALTDATWYDDIWRFEYRFAF
jgi:hypothetical protein